MEDNFIDLSNLPRINGRIDWKKCNNNLVPFYYNGVSGELVIIKHVNESYVDIMYNGEIYNDFSKDLLRNCGLGRLFNFAVANNYHFNKGDIIERKYGKLKILSRERIGKRKVKGYKYECLICGFNSTIQEGNINKGDGCSVCSSHKTLKGFNDLWTTREDVAMMLTNPSDGFVYSEFSNKRVHFTCPNKYCKNSLGMKMISVVSSEGLSCKRCGDGTSYPNKFMYYLLKSCNIEFESEVHFSWCIFPKYKKQKGFSYGVYDFVLSDDLVIIEMDSSMGHGNNIHTRSKISKEESVYRDKMKDLLAGENGYRIIRVKCAYKGHESRKKACINGCKNSELKSLINIDSIDWDEIDKKASNNSILRRICELYNDGKSSGEIAALLGKDQSSVIDYLHKGKELNLCNFIPYIQSPGYSSKNVVPVMCVDKNLAFSSMKAVEKYSEDIFGIKMNARSLGNAIRLGSNYKKLKWKKLSKNDYIEFKNIYPDSVYEI